MKAILSGSLVGLALAAALVPALKPAPTPEPDLAAVRTATEKYRDVNVALKEGYVRDPMNICDDATMMALRLNG